ncbi:MAG: M13 family metallopeptidase [Synergistaceae bacterium]|jgi:putative endopeptidase|nr:M13 family metallopeptidase [Synergistaceae bacterium]
MSVERVLTGEIPAARFIEFTVEEFAMKLKQACRVFVLAAFIFAICGVGAVGAYADVKPQDDFYEYVNGGWLAQTEIRSDRASVGAFTEVSDEIEKILRGDFEALARSRVSAGDPIMDMAVEYYRQCADFSRRDREGFEPALRDYERIERIADLNGLSSESALLALDGFPMPFGVFVDNDFADVTKYTVWVSMPGSFMGDPTYYEEGNETGGRLIPLIEELLTKLFTLAGASREDAAAETARAMAFDRLIVKYIPDAEARTYSATYYNPIPYDEFTSKICALDFDALVTRLIFARPEVINVAHKAYFEAFDEIYSERNFEDMKSWMKANFLTDAAGKLSREFMLANLRYGAAVSGAGSVTPLEEIPFIQTSQVFDDAIGIYYGKKYLGTETKRDVEEIINEEIAVYRNRLRNNAWLGERTKETAIHKLDAMTIRVGYPDKPHPVYEYYNVTPAAKGGSLYSNFTALSKAGIRYNYSLYGTVPDKTLWGMGAYNTNAYYNGTDNSITFPAGILKFPFYSPEQSDVANIAAIGTVIAHEISHAFDKNGALRDENGNLRQWWTDSDFAEFEKRTAAMKALFDGIKVDGGTVNGEITLGENIADAGGLSCALETASARMPGKRLSKVQLEEFFRSYAVMWRSKTRPEMRELLLLQDTHAPAELRVNVQLSNCGEFRGAFGVKEGDKMYIPPERRVRIW